MVKKILPIITLLGASALVVGVSVKPVENKKEGFIQHINSFENDFTKYASTNNIEFTSSKLNKYALSIQEENLEDIPKTLEHIEEETPALKTETNELNQQEDISQTEIDENIVETPEIVEDIEQISTLYSLSNDIEESCGDFCKLKEGISSAIIETQNLIEKIQNKELNLTNEQRLFITEQAQQLKSLGKQLSSITTELSFNLSDLSYLMASNNQDIDNLSLKYLVVLDNLVNGNEMLQSGLTSLNMINQMINMNTNNIPSNNQGRILYGFKQNNNPPIIKDYYINEAGELVENKNQENKTEGNSSVNNENTENLNIDTYQNTKLSSNIDTYQTNNTPRNIDTFFNTALLDNEFMYGNANYGYGINGGYGINNPYIQNYSNYEKINTNNGIESNNNTQNIEAKKDSKKNKKRFELKKNIDTFKDENEPPIKTKLGNIKNSITGFFSKFKKGDVNDKVEYPIYREKLGE